MKKFLASFSLVFLSLFAFCCAPYSEPELPKLEEPKAVRFGEELRGHPVVEIIEALLVVNPDLQDVPILVVEYPNTSLAGVQCRGEQIECVFLLNLDELMKVHFKYGEAAIAFTLGHEMAHIYQFRDGRVREADSIKDSYELELDADEGGACSIAKLGYDTRYVEHYMSEYLDAVNSTTHPPLEDRLEAFEYGSECEERDISE